jgi:ABC-type Zn uptake system ZnuABC Zn-binding protein ZnuA
MPAADARPSDADLCALLRQLKPEHISGVWFDPRKAADVIEALAAEIDVLRRVVRYADFFVEAGASSAYDEAREALTEFDMRAQAVR